MDNIKTSFINGEIVGSGTVLEMYTAQAVSAVSALSAITVIKDSEQVRLPVTVKNGTTIQIDTEHAEAGGYWLTLRKLLDSNNQITSLGGDMSFVIGVIRGSIPQDRCVVHDLHIAIGELTSQRLTAGSEAPEDATYLEVVKTSHRKTGEPQTFAFDGNGQPTDAQKPLRDLQKRRTAKYGRLSETLHKKISSLTDNDTVEIFVLPVIDFDLTGYDKPLEGPFESAPKEETARLGRIGTAHHEALRSVDASFELVGDTPFVSSTLTIAQLKRLASAKGVGGLEYSDPSYKELLSSSQGVSRVDIARKNGTFHGGQDVKVAVWEVGPEPGHNILFEERFNEDSHETLNDYSHSLMACYVIRNFDTKSLARGYAPVCKLYNANTKYWPGLTWAAEKGCSVINQSFTWYSGMESGYLTFFDHLKDFLATRNPFPLITQAAGDVGTVDIVPPFDEFVNHKTYNGIVVGSHDDVSFTNASTSAIRNPITPLHDRELPEICANGTTVSSTNLTISGTSVAAPAVAGTAALLQSYNPNLKVWPEAVRAILLAASRPFYFTPVDNRWWNNIVKGKDVAHGAGALDAEDARLIVERPFVSTAPASPYGYSYGNMEVHADFDGNHFYKQTYFIRAPKSSTDSSTKKQVQFKVALAWDSKIVALSDPEVSYNGWGSQLTIDLDLYVYDAAGIQVGASAGCDSSVEIVDFVGWEDTTYQIKIRRASVDDISERTWFGVAWKNFSYPLSLPPPKST